VGGDDVPKERKISVRKKKLRQINPTSVVVVVCFCTWGASNQKEKKKTKTLNIFI